MGGMCERVSTLSLSSPFLYLQEIALSLLPKALVLTSESCWGLKTSCLEAGQWLWGVSSPGEAQEAMLLPDSCLLRGRIISLLGTLFLLCGDPCMLHTFCSPLHPALCSPPRLPPVLLHHPHSRSRPDSSRPVRGSLRCNRKAGDKGRTCWTVGNKQRQY